MLSDRERLMSKDEYRALIGTPAKASMAAVKSDPYAAVRTACKLAGLPESYADDLRERGLTDAEALREIADRKSLSQRMAEKFGEGKG